MIKNTEQIVLELLERHSIVRQDDFLLYVAVVKAMGVDTTQSFKSVLMAHNELKLPSFETVTRCRRHLQELRPDLVDIHAETMRRNKIEEYKEYNLSGIGE